jgi:hypothetical protein
VPAPVALLAWDADLALDAALVWARGERPVSDAALEWVPVLALELDELLASDAWVPASVLALV